MSNPPLVKIKIAAASEICARFELKKEARLLLGDDGMGPRKFVEALSTNKEYITGIDFIAHALTPREGVWWGGLCLQHACGNDLSSSDKAACKAAVQWVLEPTEENRAGAKAPAEAAGPASPAGALAVAANQAEGNLASPKGSLVPPGPFASAKAVAVAVKLASTKGDPTKIADMHRLFVELGIGVADGRFLPPQIKKRASANR